MAQKGCANITKMAAALIRSHYIALLRKNRGFAQEVLMGFEPETPRVKVTHANHLAKGRSPSTKCP